MADVPVGAFLSGGIDSSAVVAIASRCAAGPVKTFTIGFDDHDGFDERAYARLVADRYATDHVEFVVKPDAVDLVERLVWHHDQPFGDSSAIPMFLLCELTRQEVTVALSGDGGDELFAGYERFAAASALRYFELLPGPARRGLVAAGRRVPGGVWRGRGARLHRFLAHADLGMPDAYLAWLAYVQEPRRRELLLGGGRGAGPDDDWALDEHRRLWAETAGLDPVDRLLELNLRTYLVDDLLVKADRTSMAHGLEVRSPFLDTALVEYAFGLPGSVKLRGLSLKRVLKHAVAGLLPPEIIAPAQARLRRPGRPLVSDRSARLPRRDDRVAEGPGAPTSLAGRARPPPGRTPGRGRPRPGAMGAAHPRGLPPSRGMVGAVSRRRPGQASTPAGRGRS